MKIVNGGAIETSVSEASVAYSAPESGYQAVATLPNDNRSEVIDRMLFVESRNGQVYSKVRLLFRINNTPDGFMYVSFNGVANTNGSRNWEATAPQ